MMQYLSTIFFLSLFWKKMLKFSFPDSMTTNEAKGLVKSQKFEKNKAILL